MFFFVFSYFLLQLYVHNWHTELDSIFSLSLYVFVRTISVGGMALSMRVCFKRQDTFCHISDNISYVAYV